MKQDPEAVALADDTKASYNRRYVKPHYYGHTAQMFDEPCDNCANHRLEGDSVQGACLMQPQDYRRKETDPDEWDLRFGKRTMSCVECALQKQPCVRTGIPQMTLSALHLLQTFQDPNPNAKEPLLFTATMLR